MKLKLLYFGVLIDVAGKSAEEFVVEKLIDVEFLMQLILKLYPEMNKHKFKVAVNQKIVDSKSSLNDGDEIAFLPPFAGG